jgi:acetyl esterase/lipase
MNTKNRWLFGLLIGWIVCSGSPVWAQTADEPTYPGVVYHADEQTLDIYLPPDDKDPFPIIFMITDYTQPSDPIMYPDREHFLEQGYAAVIVRFRPDFPAVLEDTLCALAWLHTNASDYKLDARQVIVYGYASGGLVASLLASIDDPAPFLEDCPHTLPEGAHIRGVVTFAAAFNTPELTWTDMPDEVQTFSRAVLPTRWIDGSEPPFLIIHGDDDAVVDLEEPVAFAETLEQAGVDVELIMLRGHGHGLALFRRLVPEADDAVDAFIDRARHPEE